MNDKIELLPCPFCNATAEDGSLWHNYTQGERTWRVVCDCGAAGPGVKDNTDKQAAEHWNNRSPSPAEAGTDWQSMESAPKDGTSVLLYAPYKSGNVFVGVWTDSGWYTYGAHCSGKLRAEPQFWQPLPAPPTEDK